jgi:hypothetical protein
MLIFFRKYLNQVYKIVTLTKSRMRNNCEQRKYNARYKLKNNVAEVTFNDEIWPWASNSWGHLPNTYNLEAYFISILIQ